MSLNKQIKAICFDYDGTIVDFENRMSTYTKEALINLKNKGYILALVSGRPVKMAIKVLSKNINPDIFDYIFGNNGSEYYNLKTNERVLTNKFTSADVIRIYKEFKNDSIMVVVYQDNYFLYDHICDGIDIVDITSKRMLIPKQIDFNSFKDDTPKIVLFSNKAKQKEVDEYINSVNDDNIDLFRSASFIMEVVPKGCGKHLAVKKLMEIYNLSNEEIMAIGDNDNDVYMLKECIGVVMSNATENARKVSKYTAGDINEFGIYSFFKSNNFID